MTSLKPHTWRHGSHLTFAFFGVTLAVCTDCLQSSQTGRKAHPTSPCGRIVSPGGRALPEPCQALQSHMIIPQTSATIAYLCIMAMQYQCPTHERAFVASSDEVFPPTHVLLGIYGVDRRCVVSRVGVCPRFKGYASPGSRSQWASRLLKTAYGPR